MAERKHRFDTAETTVVPRPRSGMSGSASVISAHGSDPLVTAETPPDALVPSDSSIDDLRLAESCSGTSADFNVELLGDVEGRVRQKLNSQPAITFSSLVIRPVQDGICLEGVLETNDELPDLERLVRSVANVGRVLNRLTVREPRRTPD